jgi:hypothetical protein
MVLHPFTLLLLGFCIAHSVCRLLLLQTLTPLPSVPPCACQTGPHSEDDEDDGDYEFEEEGGAGDEDDDEDFDEEDLDYEDDDDEGMLDELEAGAGKKG